MGYGLVTTYLVGWIVVFGSFVFFYHRNKAAAASKIEPWFGENKHKNLYITLLQAEPEVDEPLLKAALLRRAVEVVSRVLNLREQKQAITQLLKNGSIGEDVWNSYSLAEAEIDVEAAEVMEEADTFNQGWSQTIFNTASEMYGHDMARSSQLEIERLRVSEREVNKKLVQWKEEQDAKLKKKEALAAEEIAKELIEEESKVRNRKNKA